MSDEEATARVKIDKLLERAGWRFFADPHGPAKIRLESNVTITQTKLDAFGINFEKPARASSIFCCSMPGVSRC